LKVCSLNGEVFIHSLAVVRFATKMDLREVIRPSHINHTNIIMAVKEIKDPIEETIFHDVKASG